MNKVSINIENTAVRQKTPRASSLCEQSTYLGVDHLYIIADIPTPCLETKKEDVVSWYGMDYALYKSPDGRRKFNGSIGVFRPTVGFAQRTTLEQSGERARGTTE